jgi:hypothetical protein
VETAWEPDEKTGSEDLTRRVQAASQGTKYGFLLLVSTTW